MPKKYGSCNFRRLKDTEKSPVTALLMLLVACEGIACSAEHPTASGVWFVLPSLLSSTTAFLFCWSTKEAAGPPKLCPPKVFLSCNI